jgi:hypothetical protein
MTDTNGIFNVKPPLKANPFLGRGKGMVALHHQKNVLWHLMLEGGKPFQGMFMKDLKIQNKICFCCPRKVLCRLEFLR